MRKPTSSALVALAFLLASSPAYAQQNEKIIKPSIEYSRTPQNYIIGGIKVEGVKNYDDYLLVGISGLSVGQRISIPGDEITMAVKRYWKNGLFSNVRIELDSIVGQKAYLCVKLTQRPRISQINYNGVKKSEKEDLEAKLGLIKDAQLTPNMIDKAKILAKRYFDEKGYKNAEIAIVQKDDVSAPDKIIVDVNVDKKTKIKVNQIIIEGNQALTLKQIKGTMFTPGAFKKTNEKGKFAEWFRPKKFIEEKYEEDKDNLIAKYNELGYRDAVIVADSVWANDEKTVNVYVKIDEGQQYHIRNIDWAGNTVYNTENLANLLRMQKGDVYNQKKLDDRLNMDEDAISKLYLNNGYVFSRIDPVEVNIDGDSIDLEMRITEGTQATIGHVRISGNDRVYENVVRRELRNKPGDLYNQEALERSFREIASMGHFEQNVNPQVTPNMETGTVDINWGLTSKSNDQIEFSLGYGQTGVIGKIGLKFTNFCMANLFNRDGLRRGILPQGNGETFSISGQTNAQFYQSYSISYVNPWFGGKRPNQLSFSAFFSKQTDVNEYYYNEAYQNSYYNYLYGIGSTSSNIYENYYDPDKYVKIFGVSLGWGKRLRWPDDYFTLVADLSYQRYIMKDWKYFMIANGTCNNISLNLTLGRNSTDNPIYPRRGSEFSLTASLTPPYSLFDKKDYASLATNYQSSTYQRELQEKYRWVEYHKWKFRSKTYTALSGSNKCPVLMTRVEFGVVGSYNKNKLSPFETFYVGGDGTSGYSSTYATETIGLRGYGNGSLTPNGYIGYAYDRFTLELRYPLMLEGSTNIYALAFVEGGNAWNNISKINPFDMKRSAGVGVRIFLPMIGLMGIDWGYGFDEVFGTKGKSNIHFILGQEF